MIKRVLKNKLVALGYAAAYVENKLKEFIPSVDESKFTESELLQKIQVIEYNKPTAEVPKFFLNVKGMLVDKFLFDGKVNMFNKFSSIGSQLSLLDYVIGEKICMIGITEDVDILILVYLPSREIADRYEGKTYEDMYAEERESVVNEYMEPFAARLGNKSKAKEVMYVLLSEYVIDTLVIENAYPKIRFCDTAVKFADSITNYGFKYINRRINRIEYVEKDIAVKITGFGVKIGRVSNDPYLTLGEVKEEPDFYLNRATFAWLTANSAGKEEIVIYPAIEFYQQNTYRELVEDRKNIELRETAERLSIQFSGQVGYQISVEYILNVLKKLNKKLILPPVDFINANTSEGYEYMEPLKYRFNLIRDKREFESLLYNSIEDSLNGRYRYRFVEKLSGIYMTIGNKLNYTDSDGKFVKKQSVADFNINYNAAIVKRETLIDERSIPQLLGYMYRDLDSKGTDMLPVPSIEVVFYFPEVNAIGADVEMYNGTSIEIAKGDGTTSFNEIGATTLQQPIGIRPKDPNEKYVVVKYVNSDGKILKENIVRDVIVGSTFVPEILPVINDREGKEWLCEPNQLLSINVSNNNLMNEIEVKYIKKMARVRINYINKQGTELQPPVIKNMQVGENFDMNAVKKYVDSLNIEWNLYQSKPTKLLVSDEEQSNVLTLVYDVVKADVYVYYQTRDGKEIKPSEKQVAVANKEYSPQTLDEIIDSNGLYWQYSQDSNATVYVEESEVNVVTLLYDKLTRRVTTRFVDEEGKKIKDDVVEIIQAGIELDVHFEPFYKDIYNKHWKFKSVNSQKIKVSKNEQENLFILTYEKVFSNVNISMVNENGQRIKDDIIEKAQIGLTYKPSAIKEIEDNSGKYWICIEENKALEIDESEIKNRISYKYKPLTTFVYIQYVDIEGNELLPQKEKEVQVGSIVVPELINSLQGKDQRSWILSKNNIKEYKAKKHKEENIIRVNYDKHLVEIKLSFKDVQGNVLKEDVIQKAQLGSEFKAGVYNKITADNGERWMVTRTEPARMFVKETSKFTLIYDEIKSKVIIKCINISDSKSIIDDVSYTTKLGGVYVPNIQQKLVDKLKRRWAYVGEPAMSIITKENEQENIITLKYEPDKANVIIKYVNKNQQIVHKDVVNAEQIGTEVAIKEYEKIIEENGYGWKLKNMTRNTLIVDEDEEKNVVTCNYEPLLVPVTTKYIDEKVNEITTSKINNVQVGEKFNAVILPKITDENGKVWIYSGIKVVELVVKDDTNNKVNIKYLPLKKNVTEKFINMSNETLEDNKLTMLQVGDFYNLKKKERIIDKDDKSWIYKKSSIEKIKVFEEEDKNEIINYYDKELTKVVIKYQNDEGVKLDDDKVLDLQIGSIYKIEPKDILVDTNKLEWRISEKNKLSVKITRDSKDNVFVVSYEKYMVNVYDKYINAETGKEVIKPTISKHQVGSSYLVKVKDCVTDEEGKQWVQAAKSDVKIFTSNYKVEPITVIREEARNVTTVKYKPKLAETIIRYQDPLGHQIKMEEIKKLQVGSKFSESIPNKITDDFGNKWTYNPNSNSDITISDNSKDNLIILTYEEQKGTVTFKYYDKAKNELKENTTKLVQIGNMYVPQFEMVITDSNGCVWEYSERNRESFEVKENEKENIVELIYVPLNVNVELTLIDLWDNEISDKKIVPAQLGSKYKPSITCNYTNEKNLLYKLVKTEPESIVIKEIPITSKENPNKFKLKFEPVNSDVIIMYQDLDGKPLKNEVRISLQVGKKYKPEPVEYIKDKKGNQWQLVNAKQDEITVMENEKENVLKYVYEVAKADIIVRYVGVDGSVIIPEKHISQQVGSDYVPMPEAFINDKENKKWKLLHLQPVNLIVGSINNIVTITYQEEKAAVTWRYCDENGNVLRQDEKYEAQIGSRYTPLVSNKVIYDASQIWKLLKIEPYEIIVSENVKENLVKLIYTNAKTETGNENASKKELINPFANTLSEEEIKDVLELEKKNNKNKGKAENEPEEDVLEFEDNDLKALARVMSLNNQERLTINTLNNINTEIINELKLSRQAYERGEQSYNYSKVEELIIKEKEVIKANLDKLISKDMTGARILKIFEHIVKSDNNDSAFGKLQMRKAVLLTDYYLDKPLEDIDKVSFICERGKNDVEIELIDERFKAKKISNISELFDLKARLYYKKIMLDNYYKARNNQNDNYFKDLNVKQTMLPDITIGVTNILVKQALNILRKDNLEITQLSELEAIITLCTPQQISGIKAEIEKFDSKQKRNANKLLQEIIKTR